MNKIAILGRGESLKRLSEIKQDDIDTVILVNCFWDSKEVDVSYYKDPLIHNFIKDKKIILVMTACCEVNRISNFISKYNVISIFKTSFSTPLVYKNKVIRKCTRSSVKDIKPLPDELRNSYIEIYENFPNTGSTALAFTYAKIILKCTDIYIFGVDFYERDYYLKNNHNYKNEMNKSNTIKNDWLNFFKRHSDVNLYLYTLADFELNIPFINE